jgi:hypothetical protein
LAVGTGFGEAIIPLGCSVVIVMADIIRELNLWQFTVNKR